jgi:hypothetical protein
MTIEISTGEIAMADLEQGLTRKLYRIDCPDPLELGEYHLNTLASARRSQVAEHLVVCPHCRRELASLNQYLASLAPELELSLTERVQVWIAQLLNDGSGAWSPAFGMRGDSGAGWVSTYQAGDAQATLEIQVETDGTRVLLGLVIGIDPQGYQAYLGQDGQSIQQTALDELGNFVFNGIQPGVYDLVLRTETAEIHFPALDL